MDNFSELIRNTKKQVNKDGIKMGSLPSKIMGKFLLHTGNL